MRNKGDGSEADGDCEMDHEAAGGQDMPMDSDSEEESIQVTKKRAKRMIIDDDDGSEDSGNENADAEQKDEDKTVTNNLAADDDSSNEGQGSPVAKKKTRPKDNKKKTVDEVLTAVLEDSDSGENERKTDAGVDDDNHSSDESSDDSDKETSSQGPVRLNGDLFDAEDSSEDDRNDLDMAAGAAYDSAEDKDFDESSLDPKLLKKLKKLKGAGKKPREQKTRKCKPTKDDMLELHSESQRLMRETQVRLPYHKPAPKSLQDFMQRAKKKQEVYKVLKGARDIERAQVIQDKIAEPSIVKLPNLRHSGRSSQKAQRHSSAAESQQSLPDSGHVSGGSNPSSQGNVSKPSVVEAGDSAVQVNATGEDELPDLVANHSDGLSVSQPISQLNSQQTEEGEESQISQCSQSTTRRENSQPVSDGDNMMVEEYDSPAPENSQSQSQRIEEVESLSVKDCDSQRSQDAADTVSESLELEHADACVDDGDEATKDAEIVQTNGGTSTVSASVSSRVADSTLSESVQKLANEDIGSKDKTLDTDESKKQTNENIVSKDNTLENNESNAADSKEKESDLCASDSKGEDGSNNTAEEVTVPSLQTARQKALEELEQKGVVPALRRPNGSFIVLDDDEPEVKKDDPRSKGMQKLLDLLLKQHQKKEPKKPKDVEISIVEKTGEEGQDKGLKLNKVTYHTEGEPEADLDLEAESHTPGGRLQVLKRKLEQGMQKRRAAAFERRKQLYDMENEEGFENADDGLPEEEEEAELTDQSDTDDEGNSDADEELEGEGEEKEEKDWNNPFLDDEADEDSDDDGNEHVDRQRPVCAEINDMGDDDDNDLFQDTDQLHLELDLSDDEEDDKDGEKDEKEDENEEEEEMAFKKPSQRRPLAISDDEDISQENIPSAQDSTKSCGSTNTGEPKSLDLSFEVMTPMTRLLQDTQPHGNPHRSSLAQPIEDSQDLYGGSESDHNNSFASSAMHTSFSEDTASQMLDADGFIKLPTTQPRKMVKSSSFLHEGSQDATGGMDELMGLCSGQFAKGIQKEGLLSGGFGGLFDNTSQSQDDRGSVTSLFDSSSQSQGAGNRDSQADTDNMDDLLGLCSGQFASSNDEAKKSQSGEAKRGVKRRIVIRDDSSDEEDDVAGTGPFKLLSDDEASKHSAKNELSGSEDENEDGHDSDALEQEPSFRGFQQKGNLLQQFVEDEAELSGSEAESDENLDIAEEDDILEMELGDNDVSLSNDQLRDQVGRVHMKQMLDDDDRQLMRYKEMYLPDGDLHSEGAGRQRRFHWKSMGDDGSQQDMFAEGSDEEKEAAEDPDEKQWRTERFEREKFLESQQQEVAGEEEESNSQFLKFGKFFMKRQVSEPSSVAPKPQPPTLLRPKPVRSQSLMEKTSPSKFVKPKIPKRGSFLTRSKENLAKIAELTKSNSLNVNGTRGSRNFVFSVNSDKEENTNEKLVIKASSEEKAVPAVKKRTAHKPPAKKQCVEPRTRPKSQKSIFGLIDK
ncbi:claspin-like [Littorina saxatilis]|uniref:Claspin n=1 Tax=Littorina saxatilis TaxID=31220 RepID=A0AAN9GCR8_9CAEN